VKGVPFVKSEPHVGCVVVTRLRPIRRIVRQQDRVPAGAWCTVGHDVLDSLNILDEIVPTEVLCSLAPQGALFVFDERLQFPGLVLELNSENVAVLFDPDADVNPLVEMRDLYGTLEPNRRAGQVFVYLPGDGVLKIGFGMEDGALLS
jgi:hypothetical protein